MHRLKPLSRSCSGDSFLRALAEYRECTTRACTSRCNRLPPLFSLSLFHFCGLSHSLREMNVTAVALHLINSSPIPRRGVSTSLILFISFFLFFSVCLLCVVKHSSRPVCLNSIKTRIDGWRRMGQPLPASLRHASQSGLP